jgi:hypothetical protein
MFLQKVFQLVKLFLANLHSSSSKKYSYVLNDPQILYLFFLHMSIKNMQNFTLISNPWKGKKCTQKKLFDKNFCKLVKKEGQSPNLHPFFLKLF